ncbi:uncharacterized protein LOC134769692 [Penaeus indicus]|uniref:uncharacterized protein LOC134769692 n=1 Tax=Penaeus indicus TaxID=29960 RepID=UPI00300CA5DD
MEEWKERSSAPTRLPIAHAVAPTEYQSVLLRPRNGASSRPSAPHTTTAYSSALPHAATSSAATRRFHRHISTLPNTVAAPPEATTFYSARRTRTAQQDEEGGAGGGKRYCGMQLSLYPFLRLAMECRREFLPKCNINGKNCGNLGKDSYMY